MCLILRVRPISYAKIWRMLILVKICMGGGVAQIALFAKFTPLYLEKIYLQISILKTNFAPTLIKTKARNISSGPVPDSVIF